MFSPSLSESLSYAHVRTSSVLFLAYLLPQRLVADNDTSRDIQSQLYVASIRTNVSLSGKIMVSVYNKQFVIVAGDGAYDWCGILVLSFKGDACRAWLIKEIEIFPDFITFLLR